MPRTYKIARKKIEKWNWNKNNVQLAESHGYSKQRVRQLRLELQMPKALANTHKILEKHGAEAMRMSISEFCEKYSVSRGAVYHANKKYGYKFLRYGRAL